MSLSLDGNARWTLAHPYRGGLLAVCEAARNVACTGAAPKAMTDGLNFGNPQTGRVYWQFDRAVKGIADAAEGLGTPVISGNVSFYNESELGEVPPTPLIGAVGVIEDAKRRLTLAPDEPSVLVLLSVLDGVHEQHGLGASAWLAAVHGVEDGYPVAPDLAGERRLHKALVEGAERGAFLSAHDVSDGGLAVALAEIALASGLRVEVSDLWMPLFTVFGEIPGHVVAATHDPGAAMRVAKENGIHARALGYVQEGSGLSINDSNWSAVELSEAYDGTLGKIMER